MIKPSINVLDFGQPLPDLGYDRVDRNLHNRYYTCISCERSTMLGSCPTCGLMDDTLYAVSYGTVAYGSPVNGLTYYSDTKAKAHLRMWKIMTETTVTERTKLSKESLDNLGNIATTSNTMRGVVSALAEKECAIGSIVHISVLHAAYIQALNNINVFVNSTKTLLRGV